ncbi:hypothetical protein PoB_000565300 [Plakobranchus ocellatus]|uniref:Uncharacterized protein n=1 Tax=Plakobranchus ocellatus TaxID=259542 RepID=A0AAV3YAH5_9GAST|nr:hypothetical protein PoB_000565300 [Plakobranchus ocellatus]
MSELDLYAKYLDLGVRLGRSGEDLPAWVEDKVRQDMERSDRQIERERKREEIKLQKQRENGVTKAERRKSDAKGGESETVGIEETGVRSGNKEIRTRLEK